MSKKIIRYSKNDRINDSILKIIKVFYHQVMTQKWQIWIAFKKDFVSSYKHTALGFLWSIILPIIPISVYIFLGYIKAFNVTDNMPFVFFIVSGITIWFYISGTITSMLNAIQKEKSILSKVKYPLVIVLLSNFGKVFYELLLRLGLVIVMFVYYGMSLHLEFIVLPALFIIITIFSLGIGMILAILNEIYPDIKNIVDIFLRYGLFVSSVIFLMPTEGLIGKINLFNPFNTYIVEFRNLLSFGYFDNIYLLSVTSLVAFGLFLLGLKMVYVMEYRIKAYL